MQYEFADLEAKELVNIKNYANGLSVVKYNRKVFYDNLWEEDSRLLDARGLVLDKKGNVVAQPFRKIFNIGENGTTIDPEEQYIAVDKINGFMFAVTKTEWFGTVFSTTGSLDSDFVLMGRKHIAPNILERMEVGLTYVFECCDRHDPHPIIEESGLYLIGVHDLITRKWLDEKMLDVVAFGMGFKRPKWWLMTGSEITQSVKTYNREGYIIRNKSGSFIGKMKTKHYLFVKFASRCNVNKLFDVNWKQTFDEDFWYAIEKIHSSYTKEQWQFFSKERKLFIVQESLGLIHL